MPDVSHQFETGAWKFTPEVVAVFDEHVAANVPNYDLIQEMVAHLSDWMAPDKGTVVDVGASTGTTIKAISDRHPARALNLYAYDLEREMLQVAFDKNKSRPTAHTLTTRVCDVTADVVHRDADMTIALFVLQFIPVHQRADVLQRLAKHARAKSGFLVVAEKVMQPQPFWQEIANEATWDYKAAQGIDADTIRAKARALRGVLNPLPASDLEQLIAENGWQAPVQIYRWHSWGLWAAKVAQ